MTTRSEYQRTAKVSIQKEDPSLLARAKAIKLLLDVDGVLTDGRITYTHAGDEIKSFHTQDGPRGRP